MVLEREFWGSIRAEEKPMAHWRRSARAMLNAIRITGASGPRPGGDKGLACYRPGNCGQPPIL